MHIFILTIGTRGDFELFLTLARALRQRGHHIVMGTSGFFSDNAQAAGVEWVQIGKGTYEEITAVLRSLSAADNRTRRTTLFYKRWLQPQLSMAMNRITAIAAKTDYFISNLKMMLQRGDEVVPGAAVTYDPPHALTDLSKYGTQNHQGRILDIVAMNKKLVDPDDIWGQSYHFTGFWHNNDPSGGDRPEALARFLRNGSPPVVVTMGSMVTFDAGKLVSVLSRAIRRCGQRGVFVGGWSNVGAQAAPAEGICIVSEAAYDWLFPRAACIVHHGGVGTVAAALRAGRPSILFPQIACQEQFSQILVKKHLATGIFDIHRFATEEITTAIQTAVADKLFETSVRSWQKTILEDKGVDAAVDLIEAHLKQIHRH